MLAGLLQITAFVAVAAATVWPRLRSRAAILLFGLAAAAISLALLEPGPRSLTITHQFPAYVELAVLPKDFVVETLQGIPASRWGLLLAGFCGAWGIWLLVQRGGQPARAFGAPLLLAWSGCALQLLLEKAAGPSELFLPFDLAPDRALFPATLAGALLLAQPSRKILPMVVYVALFIAVTRLPLAVFGTLATQGAWGTHLDVHDATYFVPPGGGGIGLEVQSGDSQQLFWMAWAPHLIVFPAVYMMSVGGVAFLSLMWAQQQQQDNQSQGA